MENRNGLAVAGRVTHATGTAERRASEDMLKAKVKVKGAGCRITVGEDKAYDTADHVAKLREMNVTPHVAQYNLSNASGRQSDRRRNDPTSRLQNVTNPPGDGRMHLRMGKEHGTMRKTKHRSCVLGDFLLNLIAYNLVQIPKLISA